MSGHRPPARAFVALALASCLAAGAVCADAPGHAAPPAVPGIPGTISSFTLANGLRVVLAPDPDAAAVDVAVWYDAGLRAERPGQSGIAHLFEHLMFDGSANVPRRGHQARIDALGGSAGAVTTADGICFFETVPANGLETALMLEADRMTGLSIDASRLDAERTAIRFERMQPSQNSPFAVGLRMLADAAYGTHPYHSAVMGSDADLAKLTVKDLQDWYRSRFGPRRAVLTLVGRFDPAEATTQVRARFGPLRGGDAAAPAPKLTAPGGERRAWSASALPFPLLVVGWTVPGPGDADVAPLTLLAALLARGDASRLTSDLVEQQHLCFYLEGNVDLRRDASLFSVTAGVQPGADSVAVERALVGAIEAVATAAPGNDELARARHQIENQSWFGWQSARGRAQAIGAAIMAGGDATEPTRMLARLRACTPLDVQRAAARWLTASRRSVVWLAARPSEPAATGGER